MMMKAISMISLLVISSITHAAATSSSQTKWSGVYGGLSADFVSSHVDLKSNSAGFTEMNGICNRNTNFSSFSPGGQLGFLHQYNSNVVLGIEGRFNYNTKQTGNLACDCSIINVGIYDNFSFYNRAQASLLGRVGYALMNDSLLPFFAAGGSLADVGLKYYNESGDHYNTNATAAGWVIGTGLEWRMASTWSLRAEYYYTAYSNVNMRINTVYGLTDPNGAAHATLNTNTMGLAINYWFDRDEKRVD